MLRIEKNEPSPSRVPLPDTILITYMAKSGFPFPKIFPNDQRCPFCGDHVTGWDETSGFGPYMAHTQCVSLHATTYHAPKCLPLRTHEWMKELSVQSVTNLFVFDHAGRCGGCHQLCFMNCMNACASCAFQVLQSMYKEEKKDV